MRLLGETIKQYEERITAKTIADGKAVYQVKTYNGKTIRYKVRECRTEAEAKAVANYYTIRGRVE